MSDSQKHFLLGASIGGATYLLVCWLMGREATWLGFLGCSSVGGTLALFPDALEPATTPNHRQFFHSFSLLAVLAYTDYRILKSTALTDDGRLWLAAASMGYASHLLMDAVTPKSLPAI
jgi:membrane-bound metal-dependent hydrolase YbcI (DUF457 family)